MHVICASLCQMRDFQLRSCSHLPLPPRFPALAPASACSFWAGVCGVGHLAYHAWVVIQKLKLKGKERK